MPKIVQITLILFLFSCASTNYHPPVHLTQKEIAKGRLVDGRKFYAQRISDCGGRDTLNSSTPCDIIICKNTPEVETGLQCEVHVAYGNNNGLTRFVVNKSLDESKYASVIKEASSAYISGQIKPLAEFCSKGDVLCYLNSKYYPSDKIMSGAQTTLEAKGLLELKSKTKTDRMEISIFN